MPNHAERNGVKTDRVAIVGTWDGLGWARMGPWEIVTQGLAMQSEFPGYKFKFRFGLRELTKFE